MLRCGGPNPVCLFDWAAACTSALVLLVHASSHIGPWNFTYSACSRTSRLPRPDRLVRSRTARLARRRDSRDSNHHTSGPPAAKSVDLLSQCRMELENGKSEKTTESAPAPKRIQDDRLFCRAWICAACRFSSALTFTGTPPSFIAATVDLGVGESWGTPVLVSFVCLRLSQPIFQFSLFSFQSAPCFSSSLLQPLKHEPALSWR